MRDNQRQRSNLSPASVPPQNVLDLRQARAAVRAPVTRAEVLEHFWNKKPRARPRRKASSALTGQRWSGLVMRARALSWRFRVGAFPILAAATLLLFAVGVTISRVVDVRSRVLTIAQSGYGRLKIAGARAAARDLTGAAAAFQDAQAQFQNAAASFNQLHPLVISMLEWLPFTGDQIRSSKHLLAAAEHLSAAGSRFSRLAIPLANGGEGFSNAASFFEQLEHDRANLAAIVDETNQAIEELRLVQSASLPPEYGQQVKRIQDALPLLRASLRAVSDGTSLLTSLLGVDAPTEQLFVFQNANELRATGGFIGSFALIRLDRGAFRILDAPGKGSFGIDDYLPDTITPPLPLQVITPSWYFRDANWSPDFPTTAQQLTRFYEQARGFEPDGVIAVTHLFLERMLAITGPIELPAYGLTVDSSNVTAVTQAQVERNFDLRVNDPKKFIVDLVPLLADRLAKLELGQYPAALGAIVESMAAGDLQIWNGNRATQVRIDALGWSGAVPEAGGDFLALVNTNVGGGKSDGVINESIRDDLTINQDGTVMATVTVTRTHTGAAGDTFTGSRNRTYHRLYVPPGSRLISAEGFTKLSPTVFQKLPADTAPDQLLTETEGRVVVDEQSGTRINQEFGKTVFGNWTEVDPGQSVTFRWRYELPFRLSGDLLSYSLMLWRQPGARHRTADIRVAVPKGKKIVWSSDNRMLTGNSESRLATGLEYPQTFSLIVK